MERQSRWYHRLVGRDPPSEQRQDREERRLLPSSQLLQLPPDVVEFVMRFFTGFDLLRLSMVNHRVRDELLPADGIVWQRLTRWDPQADALHASQPVLPPRTSLRQLLSFGKASLSSQQTPPPSLLLASARTRYACRRSVRFHGPHVRSHIKTDRGGAIATPSLWEISSHGRSFSIDICFAILPQLDPARGVGGILLGAQSTAVYLDRHPFFHQQFIHIDRQGNLFCSVMNHKPVVASKLQLGRWYHSAIVWSSGMQRVYFDGRLVHTVKGALHSEWAHLTYAQLGTGCITDGGFGPHCGWYAFNGLVDDCRFWEGALSSHDVQNLAVGDEISVKKACSWSMRYKREVDRGLVSLVRCTRPMESQLTDIVETEMLPIREPQRTPSRGTAW